MYTINIKYKDDKGKEITQKCYENVGDDFLTVLDTINSNNYVIEEMYISVKKKINL